MMLLTSGKLKLDEYKAEIHGTEAFRVFFFMSLKRIMHKLTRK